MGSETVTGPATEEPAETVEEPAEEVIEEILVISPIHDPGNLTSFRDRTGEVLYFEVTGSESGLVWGTDIYTDDSNLAAAAVHAGVLEDGEAGLVVVTILAGEKEYTGSTQNDVSSWDYGAWNER